MAYAIGLVITALLCAITPITFGQLYVDTNVAWCLRSCYNNTELGDANFKLPMTINILIELIRKIENGPTPMDMKMLSSSLLHRFRQDGIQRSTLVKNSNALPYSPKGFENNKFKIIFQYLVPGSAIAFPNDTVTPLERCAIHKMVSESTDPYERGDEDQVCRGLAKYQRRIPRQLKRNMKDSVETIDENLLKSGKRKSNFQQPNPNSQVDTVNSNSNSNNQISKCPIEYGVVYTGWGAVSAGEVLAGIAAGNEPQNIDIRDMGVRSNQAYVVDNVWSATLAGNIAEDAYLSAGSGVDIKVGGGGDWNSTIIPHGYYLSGNDIQYMTDAEIRGGLDGLILGTEMKTLRNTVRSLKLSQLLDMYYSQRGLFGGEVKACKRKELFTKYAPTEDMQNQGTNLGFVFNNKITTQSSLNAEGVKNAVKDTVDKLSRYVPSLNDQICLNDHDDGTISTDLIILLDCSWPYNVIGQALANLLDNLDVNPYNTNYTIINANDGSLIINSSNSLLNFYEQFNSTTYSKTPTGFDITNAVSSVERLTKRKMDYERSTAHSAGGKSLIALFVANINALDNSKKDAVIQRLNDVIRPQIPDLKFLALTSGAKEVFENIVKDSSGDVFQLQTSADNTAIITSIAPLVKRIKNVPQRVVSAKCGSDWRESGTEKQSTQFVEPKGINYYRVHPNYFFGDATRSVKVKGQSNGQLIVCYSRDIELPRSNGTNSSSVTCKQINSDECVIDLTNACSGKSYIKDCSPLYFSVQAPQLSTSGQYETCQEAGCRFTYNLKYTISPENFGCFSSGFKKFLNIFMLITMLSITIISPFFSK